MLSSSWWIGMRVLWKLWTKTIFCVCWSNNRLKDHQIHVATTLEISILDVARGTWNISKSCFASTNIFKPFSIMMSIMFQKMKRGLQAHIVGKTHNDLVVNWIAWRMRPGSVRFPIKFDMHHLGWDSEVADGSKTGVHPKENVSCRNQTCVLFCDADLIQFTYVTWNMTHKKLHMSKPARLEHEIHLQILGVAFVSVQKQLYFWHQISTMDRRGSNLSQLSEISRHEGLCYRPPWMMFIFSVQTSNNPTVLVQLG